MLPLGCAKQPRRRVCHQALFLSVALLLCVVILVGRTRGVPLTNADFLWSEIQTSLKSKPHNLFLCICSMERYDPSKNSWETVASMADKRINFGVGVMLGFIFVVGGHNGVSHLSSIERYDPHQNQWTVCRPMKEPRTGRDIQKSQQLTRVSFCK